MTLPHIILLLAAALACALGGQMARADIYKWVSEEGAVTFSNLPPKDRNRIVEVFPSSEWSRPNAPAAPGMRQAEEIQILAERVDRLARALEDERRYNAAQPVAYPQYTAAAPPVWDEGWGYGGWWNSGWGYGGWFGPGYFAPAPVVVVGTSHRFPHVNKFHHFPKSAHFGHGGFRSHPAAGVKTGSGARFQAARRGGRTR